MSRKNKDGNLRVGRTIAGEWERQESESERLMARKKERNKKIVKVLLIVAVLGVIATIVVIEITTWAGNRERVEAARTAIVPTVEVIDEAGAGVTSRMKEYIGVIERDFAELGYTVDRAVVPAGKSREVDVFLEGRDYYIKLNIDRGTAVSAEDASRMIKYLEEQGLKPGYIDVRVKGKGYYK